MTTPQSPEPVCEVRQEAGPDHDALGTRIAAHAEIAAPLVEEVTGLRLPRRPLIRIVTDQDLLASDREYSTGMLHRLRGEAYGFQLIDETEFSAALTTLDQGAHDLIAKHNIAFACEDARMRPQVLVIASSVVYAGHGSEQLLRTVAHELTHLAQYRASKGRAFDFSNTPYGYGQRPPGAAQPIACATSFLLEGHATWADRQVTTKLLGQPVGWADNARPPQTPCAYEDGCAFVEAAIAALGVTTFNTVWPSLLHLCPNMTETEDVSAWMRRAFLPTSTPTLHAAAQG
ncbi:hypothetical protein [Streptomyces sp. NPDC059788]|uniref:hypothetical protein n=1 Tax=Streptomyces sp. NPDC059788 TaxID=3346948 RepID=UPI003659DABC